MVLSAVLGGVLAVISVLPPVAPAAATGGSATATADATATGDLAAFLASTAPKTVVLDPDTGAMVAVSLGEPGSISSPLTPEISSGTDCAPGDGCYYTPVVDSIYHDRSFYGSPGTFTGDWPRRNAWDTGSSTASACWQGACSQAYGPNTYLTFNGALVTGTSFTIH
jgi:hypothetical protein